jgi:hypothetical protein
MFNFVHGHKGTLSPFSYDELGKTVLFFYWGNAVLKISVMLNEF